jgi:hypothetical protein
VTTDAGERRFRVPTLEWYVLVGIGLAAEAYFLTLAISDLVGGVMDVKTAVGFLLAAFAIAATLRFCSCEVVVGDRWVTLRYVLRDRVVPRARIVDVVQVRRLFSSGLDLMLDDDTRVRVPDFVVPSRPAPCRARFEELRASLSSTTPSL